MKTKQLTANIIYWVLRVSPVVLLTLIFTSAYYGNKDAKAAVVLLLGLGVGLLAGGVFLGLWCVYDWASENKQPKGKRK